MTDIAQRPRGATVIVKCKRCKDPFVARVADRKRGWGIYCSKSCKAIRQTQRTGYAGPREGNGRDDRLEAVEGWGWGAHEVWRDHHD